MDHDESSGASKDVQAIKAHVEETRMKLLAQRENEKSSQLEKEAGVNSNYVRWCINSGNELGDGMLFANLNRGKFVYNLSSGEWYFWGGHYWKIDLRCSKVLEAVEIVVDRLIKEISILSKEIGQALEKKETEKVTQLEELRLKFIKRIKRLRTIKGRVNTLEMARSCLQSLSVDGTIFDQKPLLLGCNNCVVDLEIINHRPGHPEDYLTMACNVEWKGYFEPAPFFEAWLDEIFEGNKTLIEFIQRLLGYAITGLATEHIMVVFYGQGRNGKSTLVEIINYILGPLSGAIASEMLLAPRYAASPQAPRPDIMGLKGLRIAFASETEEGQKFSAGHVKWLTGGDQLTGRNPHDKFSVTFNPTHTLFLLTNFKPQAPQGDFAFWERIILIPFNLSFVDREPIKDNERRVNKNVIDKLKKEASGILSWLVRGCKKYQSEGLNPPKIVREAVALYKDDEDLIGQWISACALTGQGRKTQSKTLYDSYCEWFKENISENPKSTPSQIKFAREIARRFERIEEKGCRWYVGIDLK